MAGRPRIYDSVEDLEAAIESYFSTPLVQYTQCGTFVSETEKVKNPKPTVTGLALYLGFADKSTLYEYRDREEFSYSIKRALSMIEMYHEERLSDNNVTGAIFALKNMGWKDKTEVEQSGNLSINWHEERTYETK